jgi:hypothetical protein
MLQPNDIPAISGVLLTLDRMHKHAIANICGGASNRCEDLKVTCFARSTNLMLGTTCATLPLVVASTAYSSVRMTSFAAQHSAQQVGTLRFAAIVVRL